MDDFWETLEEIWGDTHGDPRVCVAVLDGPVDLSHRSLRHAALTQVDIPLFTNPTGGIASQHGTHIASIIFGQHDGPVRGIAPSCRGLLLPIFKDNDSSELPACSQADLAWAINRAVEAGAHIINISAGEFPRHGAADPLLEKAIRNCVNSGVLVVAAAGDQGCSCLQIPSALPTVLAVGTINAQVEPLRCNNSSDIYEGRCLLAPGEAILGAFPGGSTGLGSGSSYATAIVSGVAALLLSLQSKYDYNLDAQLVREVLLSSALGEKAHFGRLQGSRLNARGATYLLKERLGITPTGRTQQFLSRGYIREESLYDTTYAITSQALRDKYGNVSPEKFGTVDIAIPAGPSYNIPDLHYFVATGRKSMRLIPVSDDNNVTLPDGTSVPGYKVIDNYLRQEMRLAPDDPIYALLGYIRPEEHSIDLLQLPYTAKIQLGHRHLAAYVGRSRTTHVLPRKTEWRGDGPLNMKWNVDRYPANVYIISLHGVSQTTLNRNAHNVDSILASVGKEPEDPQNLQCRTMDINTTLQFYRDSIRRAEYLEDRSWFTNCAVHKTIVVNVLLNVPHNEQSFREIFGQDGIQLWTDFKRRYQDIRGETFGPENETYFTPLWKLAGLPADGIRPLTFGEYSSFHAAQAEGWLEEYTGRRPLDAGKGLAWPLETVVDLVSNFMGTYVSFQDVGGIVAAGELLLLRHLVKEKLDVSEESYLEVVCPIITKLIVADGLTKAAQDPAWLKTAATELDNWVKRTEKQHASGTGSSLSPTIEKCAENAKREIAKLPRKEGRGQVDAADWLRKALTPELDRLRIVALARDVNTGFFTSPSIIHQIVLGLHPKSPFVGVHTVCTVMDQAELTFHPSPNVSDRGKCAPRFADAKVRVAMDHKFQITEEDRTMKDVHMSLGKETGATGDPSPQPRDSLSVTPSANSDDGYSASPAQLVYALGRIGYDFVSLSRRDSIKQKMGEAAHPEEPKDMLDYLDANPHDASAIQWTLNLESTPIYVIEPRGAFARDAYDLLRQFLREQVTEGVERVSIPGVISGMTRHRFGIAIPVVAPEIRGMYSWTTQALVSAVVGPEPEEEDKKEEHAAKRQGVSNFLERVYYEIRNLGREPQERALNFAATNAFEAERVYERAIREEMELDTIEVERSPVCPPGSDCWDVKLIFFFPQRE